MHTVLVLGGSGFFGERICQALARNPDVRLLLAGRKLDKVMRVAQTIGLRPEQAMSVDAAEAGLANRLRERGVDTVIHTAGPFQGQDYTVARAAIEAGCHYIDLADGRGFVAGIDQLDALARSRGVTVVSGASSVPALSSAVVDRYLPEFERLDSIHMGISSGARAPGLATVRGVFSYAGQPIRHLSAGEWTSGYGWGDLRRHSFPTPLGARWLSRCDIPDLDLFPKRYPSVRTVSFHAGFASDAGHLVVCGLARLVRAGILPSLTPWAPALNRLSRCIEPLVSDQGGMFVRLEGIGSNHQPHRRTWSLLAARNHGPSIPCGAAIALTSKLAAGLPLPAGARPCMGLVSVSEYLDCLKGLAIRETVE
jgi:saccharopine dehydrogenase-like NADP-dependent oxidoreductase